MLKRIRARGGGGEIPDVPPASDLLPIRGLMRRGRGWGSVRLVVVVGDDGGVAGAGKDG